MRGVVASVLGMINGGATHVGVATDHVIESFRNRLWRGYKTSDGIEPDLLAQFPLLEDALTALGVVVWPMVEFEADDALAAAARRRPRRPARRARRSSARPTRISRNPSGARGRAVEPAHEARATKRRGRKFGVPPASIPDYLALVGDAADGYPGLPGWGRSRRRRCSRNSGISKRFRRLARVECQRGEPRRAGGDARTRARSALLFRDLATLRTEIPLFENVDELGGPGPRPAFPRLATRALTRPPT